MNGPEVKEERSSDKITPVLCTLVWLCKTYRPLRPFRQQAPLPRRPACPASQGGRCRISAQPFLDESKFEGMQSTAMLLSTMETTCGTATHGGSGYHVYISMRRRNPSPAG